jgi:hypothetical protein
VIAGSASSPFRAGQGASARAARGRLRTPLGAPLGIWLCEVGGLGITGVWIGLLAGMTVTTLLTLARLVGFAAGAGSPAPCARRAQQKLVG